MVEGLGRYFYGLTRLALEESVVERLVLVEDRDGAVDRLAHRDRGVAHRIRRSTGLDLEDRLVILHGQVLGQCAGFLVAQDASQVLSGQQRAVGIVAGAWRHGKAPVEVLAEAFQKDIGRCPIADPGQAQLFDQAILQGLVGRLDPPFGLRGIRAYDLDLQLLASPPKRVIPAPSPSPWPC